MSEQYWVLLHTHPGEPLQVTCEMGRSGYKRLKDLAKEIVQDPASSWQTGSAVATVEIYLVMTPGELSSARTLDQRQVKKWRTERPATP